MFGTALKVPSMAKITSSSTEGAKVRGTNELKKDKWIKIIIFLQ